MEEEPCRDCRLCSRCGTTNTKFKFFNNKKQSQPRHQCLTCTSDTGKPYFFNPDPVRHRHENGYAKEPKEETEELKNLEKVCDKCQAVNNVKFRGYNNGNANQPRYACRECKKLFSPLKKSKANVRVVVETGASSNQSQTQPATASEASDQQLILPQQQIPHGFQQFHPQIPVQNHTVYQGTPVENQQPPLQAQILYYYSNHPHNPNPIPSPQQQIQTGILVSQLSPSLQNNHITNQQYQFQPQFQQPQHQPVVNNRQWNQANYSPQQIQQPNPNHSSFQDDLRRRATMIPQPHHQPHHQPQNYQVNAHLILAQQQQQILTEIQQRHSQPSIQINVISHANQQSRFLPASQSYNNPPDARNSEELGVGNEQDPPATAPLPANRSRTLPRVNELEDVPEEPKVIFEDPYFEGMMKYGEKESVGP